MPRPVAPSLLVVAAAVALASTAAPITAQDAPEPYAPPVEPASDEGRLAALGFELPEGFTATLFAAEPLLANPVCFAVDARGAFYVAETFRLHAGVTDIREHMDWLEDDLSLRSVEDRLAMMARHEGEAYADYAVHHERVRRLVDTDGDDRADAATVYADGFSDHEDGIAAGLLARDGDVYYTCIPDLWRLRDVDGDGVADRRDVLGTGYGVHVSLLGHDLHGLIVSPDGYLYFSCGDRGFRVATEDGVIEHAHTGAVLRCELDGSGLEVVHTGLRNPQELAFDDRGDLFTGDNNSDGGDQARWVQVVQGADSGWRYPYQWLEQPLVRGPWNDEQLWHPAHEGQAAYVLPPIANLAHGPSGLACYPGTGLGDAYAGRFFLCDFRGAPSYSGIHVFEQTPKGAAFELGEVERFVWNTLPTDVDFGPDGALYFTDWVTGWNQTGKGRLYRVANEHTSGPHARATRALLAEGMAVRSLAELEGLLPHADRRVRTEAALELATRGAEGHAVLARAADGATGLFARLHGVWGLGFAARRHGADAGPLVALLDDGDAEVRRQALRVLGDLRDARALDGAIVCLDDAEPRVRFQAALALGRLADPRAAAPLVEALRAADDEPYLRHAAVEGLTHCADEAALATMTSDTDPRVRLGAVLVYRRTLDPALARFLDDDEPRVVLEAVRALHDEDVDGGMQALAARLADLRTTEHDANALVRRLLNAAFRVGDAERARAVAAFATDDTAADPHRAEALDMLAAWNEPGGRDRVTGEWRPLAPRATTGLDALAAAMTPEIQGAPEEVLVGWIRFASASEARATEPTLRALVQDDARPSAVRVAALEALETFGSDALATLVDVAFAGRDGELRAAALGVLERLDPREALPRLPAILDHGELRERRVAYELLGRTRDELAVTLLDAELARLARDEIAVELRLDLVLAAEAHAVAKSGSTPLALPPRPGSDSPLAPYLDGLFGGDARAGRRVFEDTELSCLRCHATEGADADGHGIGPALTGLGTRLTRRQMLESIVDPNRYITPGFQGSVLYCVDPESGREHVVAGRILEETGELVRVLDADGRITEVDARTIGDRRPDLSAMPEDLAKSLDRRRMRDLLAYLASL